MKLVFFSFAFSLGVILIHAEAPPTKDHVNNAPTVQTQPQAPQVQPQGQAPHVQPQGQAPHVQPQVPQVQSQVPQVQSQVPQVQPQTSVDVSASNAAESSSDDHIAVSEGKLSVSEVTEKTSKKFDLETPPTVKPIDSVPSSTTAKPIPFPAGSASWNVTDPTTEVTCIIVSGTISLTATLKNSKVLNGTYTIALGPKTPAEGTCQQKYIRWHLDPKPLNSTLQFQFAVNDSTHEVYVSRVDGLMYVSDGKKNTTVGFQNATLHAFEAPINKSYSCGKSIELPLIEEKDRQIVVKLEDFRIQAFKTSKSNNFDESIDGCPSSGGGPDVIPIVVGCALAILVVVVLVAYLINRRRSQAHGYLSM